MRLEVPMSKPIDGVPLESLPVARHGVTGAHMWRKFIGAQRKAITLPVVTPQVEIPALPGP